MKKIIILLSLLVILSNFSWSDTPKDKDVFLDKDTYYVVCNIIFTPPLTDRFGGWGDPANRYVSKNKMIFLYKKYFDNNHNLNCNAYWYPLCDNKYFIAKIKKKQVINQDNTIYITQFILITGFRNQTYYRYPLNLKLTLNPDDKFIYIGDIYVMYKKDENLNVSVLDNFDEIKNNYPNYKDKKTKEIVELKKYLLEY